ncbi:MAG TPA: VTT domain-containing protein [Polyangiaceae bacterium]
MEGALADRPDTRLKVASLLAVFGLLALAHRFGVLHRFADPAGAARTLRGLGGWGYLAFIASYALLQPFGIPGTVFVVAAPLIWPWPIAFALSMTGTMAASVVGFSFARFVARDWVESKIPNRFRKYDEALAKRAFSTVFLLRFVFWMPQLLHTFLGVSKVPFWTHFWASLAGYAVPLFLLSFFGQKLFVMLRAAPASVWLGVAAGAGLVLLGVLAARWHGRRVS